MFLVQQNVSIKPMDYDQTFMEFYVTVVVSIHSCIIFACVSFVAGKLATFMENKCQILANTCFGHRKGNLKTPQYCVIKLLTPGFVSKSLSYFEGII